MFRCHSYTIIRERINSCLLKLLLGTAEAQWLGRCAANRKVDGSIPDGVIGIFQ
jgi:hypothetical protein